MSEPKPTDPVTHMQLREYLHKYVPVEELANYVTLVELADKMEGVATVEELAEQGREMMARFVATYEAREERFKDFTLVQWAAAIRHEMKTEDARLHAETKAAIAELKEDVARSFRESAEDVARQFRGFEERMRDYMRALLEPHDGVPERVTKVEELVPKRAARAPNRRATKRR